jgi:UDP-2,3-diacylglucosamine hydrolase
MNITPGKKIYFLSDFHLGIPDYESSVRREKKIVAFLESTRNDAEQIFILGDMFDFWYEYKTVVPKGYVRLLGKLAEITDSGIPVYFFVGNHDMWMSDYFEKELNIPVYHVPQTYEWNGKKFFLAHGDGLGPGDHKYKILKKIFRSRFCQWLFGQLHPTWGIGLANYFSKKSRVKTMQADKEFLGEDKEWLIIFAREILAREHYDYFIFGHRHFPLDYKLDKTSRYINLGDWIRDFTYAFFDGNDLQLKKWYE